MLVGLALQVMAGGELLTLNGGGTVKAPVLKTTETAYFVDLGFELLRIPKEEVSEVEREEQAGKEMEETGIFRQLKGLPVKAIGTLVESVGPATVQVRTETGLGSGFLISPAGYVVTNNHVITGSYDIGVILYEEDGSELRKVEFSKVELLAQSPLYDLALLKIHADRTFPYVSMAERNSLRQGQEIFAVGSPLGLERSVSRGIVSVRNRVFPPGLTLIQHTAQINPGNSGGPLFNRRGEVVGVNNLKLVGGQVEGLGFAIPASQVMHFINNRDAYAFDPRNPNSGYHYLAPPGAKDDATTLQTENN